jgi:hypothetical protein
MTADRRLNVKRLDVMLATILACGAAEMMAHQSAQAPANLPPPFPRAGAKQLLDNDRVTVWDVVWPKGQPTPLHRHPFGRVNFRSVRTTLRASSLVLLRAVIVGCDS